MIKYVNLQFFKGDTDVQEVEKRQPKSAQLLAMDDALYNVMGGLMQRYGGVTMPGISGGQKASDTSAKSAYDLTRIPGAQYESWGRIMVPATGGYGASHIATQSELDYMRVNNNASGGVSSAAGWNDGGYLDRAFDTADDQAALTNANINELLLSTPEYLRKHQNFLDNGTDEGFEKYIAESERALANTYSKNVGTDLSNLAAKGILNSSVTNRALANQQAEIGDAVAKNRNTASNNWMNQYLQGYNTGMEGLKTNAELIPQYYKNAMSPMTPAYDFWNQSTQNWLANDKDYIATSSGK